MKWHPFAEKFPLFVGVEAEQFKSSLKKTKGPEIKVLYRVVNGVKEYVDGRNRSTFSDELGLPWQEEEVKLADDEVVDFIVRRNIRRRHLPPTLRQEIVAELRTNGHSTRAIAETVGISQMTVRRDLKDSGETNDSPDIKITGKDGKSYEPVGKPTNKKKTKKEEETPEPVDAYGTVLPAKCRDAYSDPWIQNTIDFLATIGEQFRQERMADGMNKRKRHYPFFNASDFIDGCGMVSNTIEQLIDHLKSRRPAGVCPACQGNRCDQCNLSGLVYRDLYTKLKGKK